jgi:hypothetical protein
LVEFGKASQEMTVELSKLKLLYTKDGVKASLQDLARSHPDLEVLDSLQRTQAFSTFILFFFYDIY